VIYTYLDDITNWISLAWKRRRAPPVAQQARTGHEGAG
jgi:hypothetical protein